MKTEPEQRAWEALGAGLAPRLLAALRAKTGDAALDFSGAPAPLGGGLWASLHGFRLAHAPAALSGDLVLRVMPTSDEQAIREATVQEAVRAQGFPAPRVHLSAGRNDGLGFPYIVMERVAGGTLRSGLSLNDKLRLVPRLPQVLGETLARLHALDAQPVQAALAAAGWDARSVGLDSDLAELGERARPLDAPGFAAGAQWLGRHRPAPGRTVVCHGDFHPLNLLVADREVSGVLDWSHALLAEAEYDVAYAAQLLALWPLEAPRLPRRLVKNLLGRPAASQFLRAYRSRQAVDPGRLRWHQALHAFRILVRVARARAGITLPLLAADHPWELVAADAASAFRERTGIAVELPPRRG